MQPGYNLLTKKRFLPLFLTQFFGGFNDNLLRNALVILVSYKLVNTESLGIAPEILVTVAAGLLVLPYILFSSIAGQLADKFNRATLCRYTKFFELFLCITASYAFFTSDVYLLLFLVFALGTQSTFFSPMKYSLLPDHLEKDEIITGNGFLEGGTFVAILLGSILGVQLGDFLDLANPENAFLVGFVLISASVVGLLSSYYIPEAPIANADLKFDPNPVSSTLRILNLLRQNREVFRAILGTSWFWLLGSVFLSQFPNYVRFTLFADAELFTIFLATFSIGVAAGALFCGRLLRGQITAKYAPLSLLGITFFTAVLLWATPEIANPSAELIHPADFFSHLYGYVILFSIFGIAACGGIYSVPLKAIIQTKSEFSSRSRIITGDNIINALFMVAASIVVSTLLSFGLDVLDVFTLVAIINFGVALFAITLMPETLVHTVLKYLLKFLFKVELRGKSNYKQAGKRVIIVANNTSWLDATLLAAFLPGRPVFAVDKGYEPHWLLRPLFLLYKIFRIDPASAMTLKNVSDFVKQDNRIVIFPEHRPTDTGSTMKVYEWPLLIADRIDATILPVKIEGTKFGHVSSAKGYPKRFFPKIRITILPAETIDLKSKNLREKRTEAQNKIEEIFAETAFKGASYNKNFLGKLLESASQNGKNTIIAEDINRKEMSYKSLFLKIIVLGATLKKKLNKENAGQNVGILLPNTLANLVSFFSMQYIGRTPAMLNFTSGSRNVISSCKTAEVTHIITARAFIEKAELEPLIADLDDKEIIYLEDIAARIGVLDKVFGLLQSFNPERAFAKACEVKPTDPALILFTSGSEGVPKAVVLSHKNILANVAQCEAVIDFTPQDTVLNALPMFHSFGLTVGTILPVMSGIKTFLYPSPLHYSTIPLLAYQINATMMFGTDTFLSRYAENAHQYDFRTIRYVIAGAEKLKASTRQTWFEKFGIRIFEGYGATETAPVLSVNTPKFYRSGTVGKILPGIESQIKDVPGIEEDNPNCGELWVKGDNIMLGYMRHNKPGVLQPPEDGWYNMGDIVEIDPDGFLQIKGRSKRFAKIAGEMVSLPASEEFINSVWKDHQSCVVAIRVEKKGEQLVAVTTNKKAQLSELRDEGKKRGMPNVGIPRELIVVKELPVLGAGKIDYPALQKQVEKKLSSKKSKATDKLAKNPKKD